MLKVLVLMLLLPLAWCKPHKVAERIQQDKEAEPNSLDERLQELLHSVTEVTCLLCNQGTKIAELRTRQDTGRFMRQIDTEIGGKQR